MDDAARLTPAGTHRPTTDCAIEPTSDQLARELLGASTIGLVPTGRMTMVSNVWRILLLSTVIWSAAATHATADPFIIDTGTPLPVSGTAWAFGTYQYFAGEFSLGEAVLVQSVEGYFSNHISTRVGTVTIAIHADGGNIPGDVLFSSTTTVPALSGLDWHGISGLNQVLGPGNYWASFVPNSSLSGFMPGVAPSPLSEYARAIDGLYNWIDCGPNCYDSVRTGLRISAETVEMGPVPEPASMLLVGSGLALLARARRRRTR